MNHEDHGTTCRETALITVSPFSPPVWSLVVPRIPHFPHSSQLAFLQNNGTAPHPNPITSRSSASCTLVQYVYSLGASHRQSLGCFRRSNHSPHSPLISFPSVQERMPAVVISSTSRLRHFKSVSRSILHHLVLLLFSRACTYFNLFPFLFFRSLFFFIFEPLLKARTTSPLSPMSLYHLSVTVLVPVPLVAYSLVACLADVAGARSIHLIIRCSHFYLGTHVLTKLQPNHHPPCPGSRTSTPSQIPTSRMTVPKSPTLPSQTVWFPPSVLTSLSSSAFCRSALSHQRPLTHTHSLIKVQGLPRRTGQTTRRLAHTRRRAPSRHRARRP